MTNKRQQLNYLQYQYIYSIYYKLLCLQYFQNLSSVIRILSSEPNTGITAWLYNQDNQLLNSVDNQYTYDANGNQIEEKDNTGQLEKQYIYNTENRLSEIKDENGQTIASYYYDPFGKRLSKTITNPDASTTSTYFHYNDEGYSAEKTNGQITSYLFSPQQTWSTNPILKRENNIYYYYQNDHLGTPNILHDKQGQVVNAKEMKTFGGWTNSTNAIKDNFAFAGQYKDIETNIIYNYNRFYNPILGRYIKSDPINLIAGYNLYTYTSNNPIKITDVFGLYDMEANECTGYSCPIVWPDRKRPPLNKCKLDCMIKAQVACSSAGFGSGRVAFSICMAFTSIETLGGSTPVCAGFGTAVGGVSKQACMKKFKEGCEKQNKCCDS